MKKLTLMMTVTSLLVASACSSSHQEMKDSKVAGATAELISPQKKLNGEVTFKNTKDGLLVMANVKGLKPSSVHGIHIHETGKCDGPDFKSAGGHLNPDSTMHAGPAAAEKHLGDLGNIVADKSGNGKMEVLLDNKSMKESDLLLGKAVILHSDPDDLVGQPSGNAGDRIACGVIQNKQI